LIHREVRAAAAEEYGLIVVGGGIYGAILAWEAARRGLRPLLLERADFGGGTSWSSMRIIHGGLRYLQSVDLRRFRTSVAERRWFCRTYPDLVEPLECLMPLYGGGLKRPGVLRVALWVNELLSRERNLGVREDRHLPAGLLLDSSSTRSRVPSLRQGTLRGGAVWYDASMKSSVRVLMETLRWACRNGATALNYVEARALEQEEGAVAGVQAVDHVSGEQHVFRAGKVVNCAGPWCRELASRFDRDAPELFRPSLAFNVLFDRPRLSDRAVAVEPPVAGSSSYFIVPWNGKLLAGTRHLPWDGDLEAIRPPSSEIEAFIDELNLAVPALGLTPGDVRRVYAGQLPAAVAGSGEAAHAPVLLDHGRHGGPRGLVSVSGVKWTTARDVAERTLRISCGSVPPALDDAPPRALEPERLSDMRWAPNHPDELHALCRRLAEEESVVWLDDLLLRRMDGLDDDDAFVAAVRAGLQALAERGVSQEEHLGRLRRALEERFDRAANVLRVDFEPRPTQPRGRSAPTSG
jgi:glycerol-3-phosphate dehydrogenase